MISAARRHAPSICAGLFRSIARACRVAHRAQEDGSDRLEHGNHHSREGPPPVGYAGLAVKTGEFAMADQDKNLLDSLVRKRVSLVSAVSALTAKALKLAQAISGVDMDILRLELEIGRNAPSTQLVQELHESQESAARMRAAHDDCLEEIAAAEEEVAGVDRQIAAVRHGKGGFS
jgi:hypothetical protein